MLLFGTSCKKDKLLTSGGNLKFSTDTLTFDTVFTAQGSFTLQVKIFNPQDQKVNISSIRLQNGTSSYFHLNIDGFSGNSRENIEIAAKDSMFVFATVNIDPTDQNTPFVIEDKLIATLNGTDFSLPIVAFGQNAHYITDSVLSSQTPIQWNTDKPYVIVHSALVDSSTTLVIPPKCRIYMHADSRLYVQGTLLAQGTKTDSIIFQGDRLDRDYFGGDLPGEWGGLYFDISSHNNKLDWVVMKNCGSSVGNGLPAALWVSGDGSSTNQLTMTHTIIENSIGYGLLCFNANVKAENSLVHSTGTQAIAIFQGGNYTITNCDFVNYYPQNINHTDNPTGAVLNYYDTSNTGYLQGNLNAVFTNCLIYGTINDELITAKKGNGSFNLQFVNCDIRSSQSTDAIEPSTVFTNCIFNQDPQFVDYSKWNFRVKQGSPVIDAGTPVTVGNDLDDQARVNGTAIDIGCYEFY